MNLFIFFNWFSLLLIMSSKKIAKNTIFFSFLDIYWSLLNEIKSFYFKNSVNLSFHFGGACFSQQIDFFSSHFILITISLESIRNVHIKSNLTKEMLSLYRTLWSCYFELPYQLIFLINLNHPLGWMLHCGWCHFVVDNHLLLILLYTNFRHQWPNGIIRNFVHAAWTIQTPHYCMDIGWYTR